MPRFYIKLLAQSLNFVPGSSLAVEYRVEIPKKLLQGDPNENDHGPREVSAIETSVLWYTEGKGDEDLGVHFFERREKQLALPELLKKSQRFETRLPRTPLSYHGHLLKIGWVVRLRLFLNDGISFIEDRPFQLLSRI